MPINPTAFAHVPAPDTTPRAALAGLQAVSMGQQAGIARQQEERASALGQVTLRQQENLLAEQERQLAKDIGADNLAKDAMNLWDSGNMEAYRHKMKQLAFVHPKAAQEIDTVFKGVDRTSFVEGAFKIHGALALEPDDIEGQNTLLQQAAEVLPEGNPMRMKIEQTKGMPLGPDREKALLEMYNFAKFHGAYPEQPGQENLQGGLEEWQRKQVNKLRERLNPAQKEYRIVNNAKQRIDRIWDMGTGASDLALVFNFMKMQDPESVVRESEFKTAEEARAWWAAQPEAAKSQMQSTFDKIRGQFGGLPSKLDVMMEKWETGGRLTDQQRADMKNVSDKMHIAATTSYDEELGGIKAMSEIDQIPFYHVIGEQPYQEYLERAGMRQSPAGTGAIPQPTAADPNAVQETATEPPADPKVGQPIDMDASPELLQELSSLPIDQYPVGVTIDDQENPGVYYKRTPSGWVYAAPPAQ